jgi:hypothetical protein
VLAIEYQPLTASGLICIKVARVDSATMHIEVFQYHDKRPMTTSAFVKQPGLLVAHITLCGRMLVHKRRSKVI